MKEKPAWRIEELSEQVELSSGFCQLATFNAKDHKATKKRTAINNGKKHK
jgi:hypothetical protein